MSKRYKEGNLPFKVVATHEPLIARGGLVLPYELAKALKLPKVIDTELLPPESGEGYKPKWQSCGGDREIAETIHAMNNTKQAFRLIMQC